VTVIGTGADPRLGGLDMDEAVMRWAVREIKTKHDVDLNADEPAKRRLKVEAEEVKKALVAAESYTLNVPFLTMVNGKPLNVKLDITRARFNMLIAPLLNRSLDCLDAAVKSAEEKNGRGWEAVEGILLVGGPPVCRGFGKSSANACVSAARAVTSTSSAISTPTRSSLWGPPSSHAGLRPSVIHRKKSRKCPPRKRRRRRNSPWPP
jgi:hypothetical protein